MERRQSRLACGVVLLLLACASTAAAWTDDPLLPDVTPIRRVHITELRAAIAAKLSNYGFPAPTWTDSTITVARAIHTSELQTQLGNITGTYRAICPATVPATPAWNATTAGTAVIQVANINQLRSTSDAIGACSTCCSGVCQTGTCNGSSGCVNVGAGQNTGGCPNNASFCRNSQTCNGGSCVAGSYLSGYNANCAVCKGCNGSSDTSVCTANLPAGAQPGCNAAANACITVAQTCNGSGSCNYNYVPGGTQGGCAICYACNGGGGCVAYNTGSNQLGCNATTCNEKYCSNGSCVNGFDASGSQGTGCTGSGSCYTSPQTCNGLGVCNTNFVASGYPGSATNSCSSCCNGAGGGGTACLNGQRPIGCNASASQCVTSNQTCNGSGACNTYYVASGQAGTGAASCTTCCNGLGTANANCANSVRASNCAVCWGCNGGGSCEAKSTAGWGCNYPADNNGGLGCYTASFCSNGSCLANYKNYASADWNNNPCAQCQTCNGPGTCTAGSCSSACINSPYGANAYGCSGCCNGSGGCVAISHGTCGPWTTPGTYSCTIPCAANVTIDIRGPGGGGGGADSGCGWGGGGGGWAGGAGAGGGAGGGNTELWHVGVSQQTLIGLAAVGAGGSSAYGYAGGQGGSSSATSPLSITSSVGGAGGAGGIGDLGGGDGSAGNNGDKVSGTFPPNRVNDVFSCVVGAPGGGGAGEIGTNGASGGAGYCYISW